MRFRREIIMTYQEILKNAAGKMGPYCKVCPVCKHPQSYFEVQAQNW